MSKNSLLLKREVHTPMIKQYLHIKSKNPDILLLYRMGDFYEFFYEDAKRASLLLDITLTQKGKSAGKPIPMAGVPCSSINNYLLKLLKLGESVVICEQKKTFSKNYKKLLDREIVRIVTPGTVIDDTLLEARKDNFLGAIWNEKNKKKYGYSILDITSGKLSLIEIKNLNSLITELERTKPSELLISKNFDEKEIIKEHNTRICNILDFDLSTSYQQLNLHFKTQYLDGFGISEKFNFSLQAAGCLLQYIKNTQYNILSHIKKINIEYEKDKIIIDRSTRRNLEIINNLSGNEKNTLIEILDHTTTPMGSRMLKRWLQNPIRNLEIIKNRQSSIKEIRTLEIKLLKSMLRKSYDLERVLSRIALRIAYPQDFVRVRNAIKEFPKIKKYLKNICTSHLKNLSKKINKFERIYNFLKKALVKSPSNFLKNGEIIATGYNKKLDKLRFFSKNTKNSLKILEEKERKKLKIKTLRIKFNIAHGYYIQISRKKSHLIPSDYFCIQTLKNVERYSCQELKKYEYKILSSKEKIFFLEKKLYKELFDILSPHLEKLQSSAFAIAELDVLTNLAERSLTLNYSCPIFSENIIIDIKNGRHPIVENKIQDFFISNSLKISSENRMLLITGPNMGGKSTYIRQTALIVLMSYTGSFVPAEKAIIGPIDRIFTRIGASDDLASGKSTFMMEMIETASILNSATQFSLVLMDEIGRGTSTHEGISLGWACAEDLIYRIRALTLFSTHYFELTKIFENNPQVLNVYLESFEYKNKIIFLYKVKKGTVNQSYGIKVALLAGIPKHVIQKAIQNLETIKKNFIKTI